MKKIFLFILFTILGTVGYLGYQWAFEDNKVVIIPFWILFFIAIFIERYILRQKNGR
ncbi:hypothetical protein [Flectobacillus longus]|uniref:hypothetical protein n=1 Tax=Flectobacillus longus TaxID=2984207 RepID=UPI001411F4D6|nr:hypothetical protein [Flectobacillus longus]MDI9878356.1 hypothetical protein [Flectobacillus longus]NBA78487.1 hypothetical protein [Emticicia sp. ODNR4P]